MSEPICDAFAKGWKQTDPKRIEFYATVINDMAEDIFIPSRHSRAALAESLGWSQAQNNRHIQHLSEVNQELLLLAAKFLNLR